MSLKGFNLLQDATAPPDAWDNINDWVTNVGRIIVILVEVIVISAFVSRIVIDTKTKNLLEEEKNNSQSLTAYRINELRFRDKQNQFQAYKELWNASSTYADTIAEINELRPRQIENLSMTIKDNLITIKGESTVSEIGSFETALKSSGKYDDVQVFEVETTSGGGTTGRSKANFGIRIQVKEDLIAARPQIGTTVQPTTTTPPTTVQPTTQPN